MTFDEFCQVLRRQWRTFAVVVAVAVLGALAFGAVTGGGHTASATLVVTPVPASDAAGARAPALISATGMETYADLATSLDVATGVAARLSLDTPPAELREVLTAQVPTNTYLITLTASAASRDRAVQLANAAAAEASELVNGLFGQRESGLALTIASRADPATTTAPSPVRLVPVGVVVGVLLGAGVAVGREILERTVRDEDDLRRALGVTPLARVSLADNSTDGTGLPGAGRWDETSLESVRRWRATSQLAADPLRTVLVAGVSGGEGASAVAALFANASAAAGATTLLVECDLRAPRLCQRLGLTTQPGLTDVLRGSALLTDVVVDVSSRGAGSGASVPQPHPRPSALATASALGVIPAGTDVRQPGELLGGRTFRDFLGAVAPRYDTLVVDGAPILPYADSVAVAAQVDAVVLVVVEGTTSRRDVDAALAQLAAVGATVAGAVLVAAR
ncbi:hypothetical protein [Haloechinothrix halophila]|uniref:hypothetical protein n=1 Tax=Haloechinothrix halophila TaxID=1069073 RepID=UPI000411D9F9|nr:hypothetical protein [Haloechinothrix halophila]